MLEWQKWSHDAIHYLTMHSSWSKPLAEEEDVPLEEEERKSSKGEDIKMFVGPVGQPICPSYAQIDSPPRMVFGCLQATVY